MFGRDLPTTASHVLSFYLINKYRGCSIAPSTKSCPYPKAKNRLLCKKCNRIYPAFLVLINLKNVIHFHVTKIPDSYLYKSLKIMLVARPNKSSVSLVNGLILESS